ncbi:MAG: gliding motility lipoprotein GldH [Paludibacteraceae bacterium]|nr:gliding motility lipoprotein GldH [Paludibacteraceae bacterium]
MRKVLLNIVAGLSLLSFASCDDGVVQQEVKEIPETGWEKETPVEFEFSMQDTTSLYEVVVDVRNKSSYMYQNLWLFIEAKNPKGEIYSDTIECILADNKGRWIGDGAGSFFSGEYRLPVSFMPQVLFGQPGDYKFSIYQGMREDVLLGLSDVGIRIRHVRE